VHLHVDLPFAKANPLAGQVVKNRDVSSACAVRNDGKHLRADALSTAKLIPQIGVKAGS
jgi:hypothetical protein